MRKFTIIAQNKYISTLLFNRSDMKLYKVGAPVLPDSCMPLGMKATDNMTKLWPIQPGPSLVHHLLALSYAETAEQDVLKKNIMGYVCV